MFNEKTENLLINIARVIFISGILIFFFFPRSYFNISDEAIKIFIITIFILTICLFLLCLFRPILFPPQKQLKYINKKIDLHPQKAELYIQRAEIKNLRNDFFGAAEDCNIAINIEPDNSKWYFLKGMTYYEKCFYKDAAENIEKANDIKKCKEYSEKIKEIYKVLNSAPNKIDKLTKKINKIDKNYISKDYSQNEEVNTKEANLAQALYERADFEYVVEDYEKAVEDYKKADEIDNFECMFPFYKVINAYIKLGNYDKATEEIESHLKKYKIKKSNQDISLLNYIDKLRQEKNQ